MDTNETGREPTEPTDAELLTALFYENNHGTPESFEAAELAAIQRGEEITNRGPVPDTPAPDEVAQLRAEVARLKEDADLFYNSAKLWEKSSKSHKARVAELEAERDRLKGLLWIFDGALTTTYRSHPCVNMEDDMVRVVADMKLLAWYTIRAAATGKEPTSE